MEPTVVEPPQQTAPETQNTQPVVNSPTPQPNVPGGTPPTIPPTQAKGGKGKKVLLLIIALLLLAGIGGFAYWKVNNMTKPAVTADEAPKDVSELRIGTTYPPFDKVYPDPNFLSSGSWTTTTQLYEGLVGFKDANSIVPLLAESWTNPDTKTWEFKLKPNIKFHNGKTLVAEDVVTSINKAIDDPNTVPLLIDSIDSVTAKDENTVVIKTKEPDAILLNKTLFLYVQGDEKLNGLPVGTGAYHVADGFDIAANPNEMKLVAFDDYHGGRPAVRTVSLLGYQDNPQMLAAVQEGKIDISDLFIRNGGIPEDVAGYEKRQQADGFIAYLGINAADTDSPLSKLAVRQALYYSIDPVKFIEDLGDDGSLPASQISNKYNFGYNPDMKPAKRDVAKAKSLLAEAGYPDGLTLVVSYAASEGNKKEFESLKAQAAEAGITLTEDVAEDFNAHTTKITDGTTQVYKLASSSALLDSYDLLAYNFQNANFKNDKFDDLLAKSNAEFNGEERKKLLQQASKLIVDEVAAIPLAESAGTYYVKNNLNHKMELGFFLPGGYIRNISGK